MSKYSRCDLTRPRTFILKQSSKIMARTGVIFEDRYGSLPESFRNPYFHSIIFGDRFSIHPSKMSFSSNKQVLYRGV